MHHAVHTFLDFDKRAEVGEVADLTGDFRTGGIFLGHFGPWIRFELASAEGNLLLIAFDFQHHRVNLVADFEYVGSPRNAFRPRQFADVHHTFDAFFQLHKRAVRHHADNLAVHLAVNRILQRNIVPRIPLLLLESKRNAFLFPVDFQNHHFDLRAHLHHFAGVIDSAPTHIGDVQQTVQAVEINERAEIGQVLHDPFPDFAHLHFAEQRPAAIIALKLDQFPARQDNVLALLVDFHHFEFESLADIVIQVPGRNHINLRRWQECLHADVDRQPTFDLAANFTFDGAAFIAEQHNLVPVLLLFGFLE